MIRIEKVDTHEGVIVKVLLDSNTTGMFVDKKFIERNGFVTPLVLFLFFCIVVGDNTHVVLMLCFCSWYLFLVPFFYLPSIFHWPLCLATR